MRIEIEEKNMKIETLNTKLMFLQNSNTDIGLNNSTENNKLQDTNNGNDNNAPLIKLATDDLNNERKTNEENSETTVLNNKIEKLEQLLNKYKESLKSAKERNGQLTMELQKVSTELETKIKENEQLQAATISLTEAREKIQELNENIEYLQNKNNSFEFSKNKELSILEINLKNAQEEITNLHEKIEILSKREEEYAISLAENKLSIHKELESKEAEIKSLNDSVANSNDEIQSLNIIINDYKSNISQLEDERSKLRNEINDLNIDKAKIGELKAELEILTQKYQSLEQMKSKADEEYNCLQLQVKQETAEKLAMIDRNVYLENRNTQLIEENTKKSSQISNLEKEIQNIKIEVDSSNKNELEKSNEEQNYVEEVNKWKLKCSNLESEIQEERVELVKLQSEIEKLLSNHESIQSHNEQLISTVASLKSEITVLKTKLIQSDKIKTRCKELKIEIHHLRVLLTKTLEELKDFKQSMDITLHMVNEKVMLINEMTTKEIARLENENENLRLTNASLQSDAQKISEKYKTLNSNYNQLQTVNNELKSSIHEFQAENSLQIQKIQVLQNQNENNVKELNNYAQVSEKLNEELKTYNLEKESLIEKINALKQQNDELLISLKETETNKETSHNQFKNIADKYDDVLNKFNVLTKEHSDLLEMKEDYKKKTDIILDLEKQIDNLNQENTSLKKLSEIISKNVTDIEHELKEVRESHSLIEIEKDRLNSVICELESNIKKEKDVYVKDTQTDNFNEKHLNDSKEEIERLNKEIEALKNINNELSEEIKDHKLDLTKMEESLLNQNERVIELNSLKEENKRLQSDIEGLQSYMTKVSKENSQLNDKLREIIATNDGFPEKNDILIQDLESLKSEIQLGKDKIDNLIRENSLLAEENLELKDQIKSQTYTNSNSVTNNKSDKNEDIVRKYSNAIETKNKLEKKLHDMELINQSVNGNMQQMQENNEKLRLSNEKLERRLDEALVSLRHLHSLQENTELEYLRNILYEYLTGSGTHSMTLAKVLSAVVKFDTKQTEMVLEKEKERQSLVSF